MAGSGQLRNFGVSRYYLHFVVQRKVHTAGTKRCCVSGSGEKVALVGDRGGDIKVNIEYRYSRGLYFANACSIPSDAKFLSRLDRERDFLS